jgi:macrodomain Ter protein organizer (MatP/YcbG family)
MPSKPTTGRGRPRGSTKGGEDRTKAICLLASEPIWERLRILCVRRRITMSSLLREMIDEALARADAEAAAQGVSR